MKKLLTAFAAVIALMLMIPLCSTSVHADESCADGHKRYAYTMTNASNYPFVLDANGNWQSTNKGDNTSATATLYMETSGSMDVYYSTSSEANYDKLIIKKNGSEWATVSGIKSWTYKTMYFNEGDIITFTYSKDISQSSGSDTGSFSILGAPTVPMGDVEAKCEEDIICDVCREVVKEAAGHTYQNDCDADCDVCGLVRDVMEHVYKNSCDADCDVCGVTREGASHTYSGDCDAVCNTCGESRTVSEGHKKYIFSFTNATNYPFAKEGELYYSINTSHGSSATATVSVLENGWIELYYYTSTERGYDRLIVKHNDATLFEASGETELTSRTLNVAAGDVITLTYSKDGSASSGYDFVAFALQSSYVPATGNGASCEERVVCDECGEVVKEAGSHVYANNCDATCDVCGSTRNTEHVYDNNCDAACNVCGETRAITHVYTNNCDTSCDVCGAVRTIIHTYSNACDAACDICGETRTPAAHQYTNSCDETCNECEAARKVTHSYKTTTTKATFTKKGSIVKKCTLCGKVESNKTIQAAKSVKLSATSYMYNGKVKSPSVVLKDASGKTLKKNTDYTVTYASGRKKVGTYKVTVKLKGNYSGTKTLTFTIKPTTKTTVSAYIGETSKIGAKSNTSIKYSSGNKKVATVSSKGVITAVGSGSTTITVKSGSVSQKIKVTVKKPTVKISASKSSMYIGDTLKLSAKTTPSGAKVTWSVNNKKLATISSSGKLKALSKGTVTVTAKVTYKGKTYKNTYKVKIDVQYPDISVFISQKADYTSAYAFVVTNNSSAPIKILNKGYVYCNGESENIVKLFSNGGFSNSYTIKAGKSGAVSATLEKKMLFLNSKRVALYFRFEYKGETFTAYCDSSRYGVNKCSTITWLQK